MKKITERRCWVCNCPITWVTSDTACNIHQRQILLAESYRLAKHTEEAYRKRLAYDLSLAEWTETLRHFHWRCAYCEGPFESLDHVVPVSSG